MLARHISIITMTPIPLPSTHFIVSLLKVLLEMAKIKQSLLNLCRVEKQATSVT